MSDAKPLTTADAATLGEAFKDDEALAGSVVVDRAELLATTRALERVTAELENERRAHAAHEAGEAGLIARAEKAEHERDAAKTKADIYERDWYSAKQEFGDARAKLLARAAERQTEIDATRSTVAELVAALKPLCHPGTSGRSVVDWERARAALAKAKGGAP